MWKAPFSIVQHTKQWRKFHQNWHKIGGCTPVGHLKQIYLCRWGLDAYNEQLMSDFLTTFSLMRRDVRKIFLFFSSVRRSLTFVLWAWLFSRVFFFSRFFLVLPRKMCSEFVNFSCSLISSLFWVHGNAEPEENFLRFFKFSFGALSKCFNSKSNKTNKWTVWNWKLLIFGKFKCFF